MCHLVRGFGVVAAWRGSGEQLGTRVHPSTDDGYKDGRMPELRGYSSFCRPWRSSLGVGPPTRTRCFAERVSYSGSRMHRYGSRSRVAVWLYGLSPTVPWLSSFLRSLRKRIAGPRCLIRLRDAHANLRRV